jgi:hypothetical protein
LELEWKYRHKGQKMKVPHRPELPAETGATSISLNPGGDAEIEVHAVGARIREIIEHSKTLGERTGGNAKTLTFTTAWNAAPTIPVSARH